MVRVKDADFIPPPPASLAAGHRSCDMVDTDARFNVKDVGKISFFIYIFDLTTRWRRGHLSPPSKHSLQSSTYGRDQEWVLLAPAPGV